ncbi:8-amino-7-oxononanoate synthase [Leeia oryzae]|uniref:8-amino-7-oxononanoate synthase n=1 Tax=Leeia oryzae TaxID=356662 RepID=UPI00036116F9|nr:8-amino-7-oxononanoate synthase [Leeia oryzae]
MFERFSEGLAALTREHRRRHRRIVQSSQQPHLTVDGVAKLSFCSNDYLGLAAHPALAAAACEALSASGLGTGASHLVSGHHLWHERLEEALASWLGRPCLTFATGYTASVGIIPALVDRADAIFMDKLNHASLNDGCLLSRASTHRFRHNDTEHLRQLLEKSDARQKLIVVDGIFSMDGDMTPLPAILALAEAFDAWIYLDDAHGIGVLGEQGRGTASHFGLHNHPRLIQLVTFGKAAGSQGAAVCAEPVVIDWLMHHARSHIFTTAAPALLAASLCASIDIMQQADDRRAHLQALIARWQEGSRGLPWAALPSQTPIQGLVIGSNEDTLALANALWQDGIWVPAIRPPTVPEGTARLRISLSASHTLADVDELLVSLTRIAQSHPTQASMA